MILIFSTIQDHSTQTVVDWLLYYQHRPVIINELNPIVDIDITIKNKAENSIQLKLKSGEQIHSNDVKVIWYRRGTNFFCWRYNKLLDKKHLRIFHAHLEDESSTLTTFIFNFFKSKTIGDFELTENNKLNILIKASSIGLLIPPTEIITTTEQLPYKLNRVSKNIKDIITTKIGNHLFYNRTSKCEKIARKKLFPSLLQDEIKKKYELRIFYFDKTFYTMAIFSQQNKNTKLDFRDITQQAEIKYVSFKLPNLQEIMLLKLINELGYTTCSIDMIVDITGKFYFLELNPVGQFGMVSIPCNYYIEKNIALKLIKYVKEPYRRA